MISLDGEQLGVVTKTEALSKAKESELDLILIASNANPPVCKLEDWGQFLYKLKKKEKNQKKSIQILKEIKLSHKISENDYMIRVNRAKKFLGKNYKIKVTITFRGREVIFMNDLGIKKAQDFIKDVEDYGVTDGDIVKSVRNLSVIISPK